MTDIVEWLRHTAGHLINGTTEDGTVEAAKLCQAADTIEQYRADAAYDECTINFLKGEKRSEVRSEDAPRTYLSKQLIEMADRLMSTGAVQDFATSAGTLRAAANEIDMHAPAQAPIRSALERVLLDIDFMVESGVIPDIRDDIIYQNARSALSSASSPAQEVRDPFMEDYKRETLRGVREATIEECAAICEGHEWTRHATNHSPTKSCAIAIRALKASPVPSAHSNTPTIEGEK